MSAVSSLTQSLGLEPRSAASERGSGSPPEVFAEGLGGLLKDADSSQKVAESHVRERALGEGDLVQTMVALSKADLSLRMIVNVRNRALEAYQEIMRMPV